MADKPLHMVFFTSSTILGWQSPWAGRVAQDWRKPRYWADLARTLEDACFDGIVAEDQCFIEDGFGDGTTDFAVKNGIGAVKFDPAVLATIMASATSHIGITPTLNITEWPPYLLARMMNSLDHLSGGRIGWNVVTGHSDAGPKNHGLEGLPPHHLRYAMAAEYMDVCDALWTSWDEDALMLDPVTGQFADPAKVHRIDFEGEFYKSRGPLNNSRSPQVRPAIFQAGASPQGRNFASKYADGLVGGMTGAAAMKAYRDDVRARAAAHGRSPDDIKVFFQVSPIIGATMEEAKEKERAMIAATAQNLDMGFAVITLTSGADFTMYPLDMPMSEIAKVATTNFGTSSLQDMFRWAGDMTLKDFITYPPRWRLYQPVGTPDSIAAEMDEVMQEVGGDGFLVNIMGETNRRTLGELCDGLVPALQKRGLMRTGYEGSTFRENLRAF
jgi:FMN-dependent oxidoreductase (nitrilotriacetate monooxygenase family)